MDQDRKPYIGITGFMTQAEVETALRVIPIDSSRLIMVGVLVSHKTLGGQLNRWPNRYPIIIAGDLTDIFVGDRRALNLVHFNTHNEHFGDELLRIERMSLDLMGFQLNIAWPSAREIEVYRLGVFGTKTIVLQLGSKAMAICDNSPAGIAAKLATDYPRGLIDYVLIDPSGGFGQPFDPDFARQCLRAIRDKDFNAGLGVAGGLGPNTLHLVEPLIEEFPDLSIDAEGQLRDEQDHLDLVKAKDYLQCALRLFGPPRLDV